MIGKLRTWDHDIVSYLGRYPAGVVRLAGLMPLNGSMVRMKDLVYWQPACIHISCCQEGIMTLIGSSFRNPGSNALSEFFDMSHAANAVLRFCFVYLHVETCPPSQDLDVLAWLEPHPRSLR